MKILFDLQLSNFDAAGQVLKESDSNYVFTSSIAAGIEDVLGWETCIISPHRFIKDSLAARYDCDLRYYQEMVKEANPDIIWTNDPCRVGAYRTFWKGALIAYNHWIDNDIDPKTPSGMSLFFRQAEAAYKADLLLFNTEFGARHYLQGLRRWTNRKTTAILGFVNPPLKIEVFKDVRSIKKTSKLSILYNHRLSTARQYADSIEHLVRLMDELDVMLGPKVYEVKISNPSQKQHSLFDRPNVVNIYSDSYSDYIAHGTSCWAHVNFFTYPGQWSIATAEALALGLLCFIPMHSGYIELAGRHGINCLDPDGKIDIQKVIRCLLNAEPSIDQRQASLFQERLSPSNIVRRQLVPFLQELTENVPH